MKASLGAIIDAAKFEAGPPMADRERLLADLDERLADVERQHAQLVDEAAEAGIVLSHMDGERGRRIQAEQRAQYVEKNNALNRRAIERGVVEPMK